MRTDAQATLALAMRAEAELGEGPVWDSRRGVLWWVDVTPGILHRLQPLVDAGGHAAIDSTVQFGEPVGSVALRRDGSLLVAASGGLIAFDPEAGSRTPLVSFAPHAGGRLHPTGTRRLRCNDGKCDPAGRFWVGRLTLDLAPGAGELVRVDPDRTIHRQLSGLTIPNGLGWSADGSRMYFIDSPTREVREHPYDEATGTIGEGQTLVRLQRGVSRRRPAIDAASLPDGMTVDADGCLWIALWGAGCAVRVSPGGQVMERLDLPVSRVTSCTFGGPDLGDLYLTTARGAGADAADAATEPLAGSVFVCRPGVRGLLPVPYAG